MSHSLLRFFHEINNVSLHDDFCKCVHFFPAGIPRQRLIRCMPCHVMRMVQQEGDVRETRDRDRDRDTDTDRDRDRKVQEMDVVSIVKS